MPVSGLSGIQYPVGIPRGGDPADVLTKQSADDFDVDWDPGGGGGGAPATAEYLVSALHVGLVNERLITPDETMLFDFSVPNVAGVRVVPESSQIVLAQQIFGG
jgi:hypothetical protein